MVSSCATCTTTRLILVNGSSRSRQVRSGGCSGAANGGNGSSSSSLATTGATARTASRDCRIMSSNVVGTLATAASTVSTATSFHGGVVNMGSSSSSSASSPSCSSSSSSSWNASRSGRNYSASSATAVAPALALSTASSTSLNGNDNNDTLFLSTTTTTTANNKWTPSELVLSTLFALGVSASFLLGTSLNSNTNINSTPPLRVASTSAASSSSTPLYRSTAAFEDGTTESSSTISTAAATAPKAASRSLQRMMVAKDLKGRVGGSGGGGSGGGGGGPPMHSSSAFMAPMSTSSSAAVQEDLVDDDTDEANREEARDVFAMGKRTPYDISVSAQQGERESMEDTYFVAKGGRFAAVYDGHGGDGVSSILQQRLFSLFQHHLRIVHEEESEDDDDDVDSYYYYKHATKPTTGTSSIQKTTVSPRPSIMSYVSALNRAFAQVDDEIQTTDDYVIANQGSTAVAVAIHEGGGHGSNTNNNGGDGCWYSHRTLVSANVGDSRAILSRNGKAVDLTRDHKPNEEGEKARILGMGGTIQWDSYGKVHRVLNLSTSRAIGDRYARPMVTGQVEIKQFPIMEHVDEFFLVASDGLWDVMTSQEVVDFVHEKLHDINNMDATFLSSSNETTVQQAQEERKRREQWLRRNMARFVTNESIERGTMDNVTVVIVWLRDP